MTRFAALLVVAAAMAVLAGCGGDEAEAPVRPLLDQIAPAMAAVETELGGPQQYFEVNATPLGVNVFVATEDATQVVQYVYAAGELLPPADPAGANGPTFSADAVTFDPATILAGVTEDLPESNVVRFSIAGDPLQFGVEVQSDEGGTFEVTLATDGSVVSVDPGS